MAKDIMAPLWWKQRFEKLRKMVKSGLVLEVGTQPFSAQVFKQAGYSYGSIESADALLAVNPNQRCDVVWAMSAFSAVSSLDQAQHALAIAIRLLNCGGVGVFAVREGSGCSMVGGTDVAKPEYIFSYTKMMFFTLLQEVGFHAIDFSRESPRYNGQYELVHFARK
jgi:hypothetical protein